jgi:hypothetical protein
VAPRSMSNELNPRKPQAPEERGYKRRILLVLGILCFIGLYQWDYINWLSPAFSYYGFEYYPPPTKYLVLAWICSVIPSLWMPLQIKRASQLGYWVLYLTVLIPSMFVPLFARLNEPPDIAKLVLTMCLGFAICGAGYWVPLGYFRSLAVSKFVFWRCFFLLALVCSVWVVVALHSSIHLVSFAEVADLRGDTGDAISGTLVNYPLMWLYGAINPFMVAWGLYYKKIPLFVAGVLGQVLVYSIFATKASLLSILFIVGLYLMSRPGRMAFAQRLTWSVVALFLALCLSFALSREPSLVLLGLLFLVFFRSFGLAGLLTGQYYCFIQHNPLTYFSHVKGINWFLHYPFHYQLGTEIGYYYYTPLVDTTAHFWATDGLAALGLPGILVISAVCALLFWFIDSISRKHDPRLAGLVIFYATYSLANLSMFTTLLSGGLGLLIAFLYVVPRQEVSHSYGSIQRKTTAGASTPAHGSLPLPQE